MLTRIPIPTAPLAQQVGLPPDPRILQTLSDISKSLKQLVERVEALSPTALLYSTFPQDGSLEPLPAGETTFNFKDGTVIAPDGTPSWGARRISPDFDVLKYAQSAVIIPDSLVTVRITPGVGAFQASVNAPVFGRARKIEEIKVTSEVPYLLYILVGTSQSPPNVNFQLEGQARYRDITLTKGNAALTADSYTNIGLVPRWASKVLSDNFAQSYVFSGGLLQKIITVTNLGVVGVELRVLGGAIPTPTLGLESLGLTGFILDTDIHVPGTPTENFVSLASGDQAVLETGIPWGILRLQARVTAANLPGFPARLIVQYIGFTAGTR